LRRTTKAALGGLAGFALVLGGTGVANGALSTILKVFEDTEDLRATTPEVKTSDALDSAKAKITIAEGTNAEGTNIATFTIRVTDIDPSIQGVPLGGHLHIGECVEGQPAAAGPHYNHQVAVGGKTYTDAEVSTKTEVWFDLKSTDDGMAYDATTVQFVPVDSYPDYDPDEKYVPGVMSIVIHERETDSLGGAGAREACFPLSVPDWVPTESV
jgi:Cu/Zn superoxide dismutase